jgi:hypothetical protein
MGRTIKFFLGQFYLFSLFNCPKKEDARSQVTAEVAVIVTMELCGLWIGSDSQAEGGSKKNAKTSVSGENLKPKSSIGNDGIKQNMFAS